MICVVKGGTKVGRPRAEMRKEMLVSGEMRIYLRAKFFQRHCIEGLWARGAKVAARARYGVHTRADRLVVFYVQ